MAERDRYHLGDLPGRLAREARAMLREEGGLKRLNLRALAARTGITAGSMYHHFASKTELLGVLAAGGFLELKRDLERATGQVGAALRLRAWANAYVGFFGREPALFELMFDPVIAALRPVVEARNAVIAQLRIVVGEVAEVYGRGQRDPDAVALAVWAAAHGAAALGPSVGPGSKLMGDVINGLEALFGASDLRPPP